MPAHAVNTRTDSYTCTVERCILSRVAKYLPEKHGKLFVVTTEDVWKLHGAKLIGQFAFDVLFFPGGEERKRLSAVEDLADQMAAKGADRTSVILAFGGGIVGDLAGFLAAIFMRGIPFLQLPTTLLAQVDASIGGKTGGNLMNGKNLIGAFHQPRAVLIDPEVLSTLPAREYNAGLFEVVKTGVIRSPRLFELLTTRRDAVLAQQPDVVDEILSESVRIKCEVVTADEKEGDLRRILNYGHTVGHALEAETKYAKFLHGEAVSFGMTAATYLAEFTGYLDRPTCKKILNAIAMYGPIPSTEGITAQSLFVRLVKDKKTIQGAVHFVLPDAIGSVKIVNNVAPEKVLAAIEAALT